MTAGRRTLQLSDFDDVVADVDRLEKHGYTAVGKWNLAQCCGHLANWLTYPLDGYPQPAWPIRVILWGLKHTIAPGQLRKVLETGTMPAGGQTMPATVPAATADTAEMVQRLKTVIERHKVHPGPWHPSPLFGQLSAEDGRRLQLIHCAHHLSFLIPRDA